MSVLEFENTQGIMMQYSTATVLHRASSYLIDIVLLGIVMMVFTTVFASMGDVVVALLVAPIFFFYSLLMEIFNDGRSIGKMLVGLKVVRVDGRPPRGYDYLMRWMFRWVDIYMSGGALAAMLVAATPRNQRVGDMLADTTVIHTKNLRVPLKRILHLNTLSSYKPVYEQASSLSEEQVLLAKEALQRSMKYKNDSHREALTKVAHRLAENLGVNLPANAQQFVQTVIKDYIALTR